MARSESMETCGVKITSRVLSPGTAAGPPLVLLEPLSFWGAYDPATGTIIDTHHPQCGASLTGSIVLMPETRGSGSTPGAIAESIRRKTAPSGIVLLKPDVNVAIGSFIAATLYGLRCPVVSVCPSDYERLAAASHLSIFEDGSIEVRL